MEHDAGIEVSLESSCICVVDGIGRVVREATVGSEPAALIAWFGEFGIDMARIGLEAGPRSQWLYGGLRAAGLAVELLETRHVRGGCARNQDSPATSCGSRVYRTIRAWL